MTPSKALAITSPNGTPISIATKAFDNDDGDELKAGKGGLSKHLSSSLDEVEGGKQERIDWWGCSDVEDNNHHLGNHDNKISPNKLSSSTSNLTLLPQSEGGTSKIKTFKARTDWWESDGDDGDEEDDGALRIQKKHNSNKTNSLKANGISGNGLKVNGILNGKMTNGILGNGVKGALINHDIVQSRSSEDFVVGRVMGEDGVGGGKKKLSYKLSEIHKRVTGWWLLIFVVTIK